MTGRSFSFSFGTSSNPLVQILSLLVFAVLLVAALIMGAFVIAVLLGFAVIAALVFAVRVWWLKRKYGARPPFDGGPAPPGEVQGTRLIEGEYQVLSERDPEDERREP
jgi:uncharacterized iron-regulated membrane protein